MNTNKTSEKKTLKQQNDHILNSKRRASVGLALKIKQADAVSDILSPSPGRCVSARQNTVIKQQCYSKKNNSDENKKLFPHGLDPE